MVPCCSMHFCKCKEGDLAKVHHTCKICHQKIHGALCGHVDKDVFGGPKFICFICKDLHVHASSDILEVPHRSLSDDDSTSSKEYGGIESFVTPDRKKILQAIVNRLLKAKTVIRKCKEFLQWQ